MATPKQHYLGGVSALMCDFPSSYIDGLKVGPRLRELAHCGQREPGGGIHAT